MLFTESFLRAVNHRRAAWALHLIAPSICSTAVTSEAFTEGQVRAGEGIVRRQCARCHPIDGSGKDQAYKGLRAPELIGPQVFPKSPCGYQKLRRSEFRIVHDVYDFASAAMPADQPASLELEYLGVLAYLLAANGMLADGTKLSEQSSRDVSLEPLHRRAAPAGYPR